MRLFDYSMIVGEAYAVQCTTDSTKPTPKIRSFVKSGNTTR